MTQPAFQWYIIDGVNPEPWAASEATIGRKGGKLFPHFHKPEQLRQYQESVKDIFPEQNPQAVKYEGDIELTFFFWRQQATYEVGEGKATRQSAQADATNLQKALEDALQGVLYENDRDIRSIRSVIVEQTPKTEPAILVCIGRYNGTEEIASAKRIREGLRVPIPEPTTNLHAEDVEDLF